MSELNIKMMKSKAVILSLVVLAGVGFIFFQSRNAAHSPKVLGKNSTIELTSDGFSPNQITISKGSAVKFITTTGKPFWPASNLHPNHGIYPEFDPKQPIDPHASWSFTFDEVGTWNFHDHLAPLYRGSITVLDQNSETPQASIFSEDLNDCAKESDGQKMACWEDVLRLLIKNKGITAAFAAYAELYNTEPIFAENCHDFTHQIGEAAYIQYAIKKDFGVTQAVAYCSYGFFHGFIEAMFQDTGTLEQAREFCEYIDNKLKGQTSAFGACMHGIGHGVTDGSDETAWGDVNALIAPGKKLCEQVGKTDYEKQICGTGVFNSLEGMYLGSKYKLNLDRSDPLAICRKQETSYFKKACFDDFKDILMVITDDDFAKAAKFIEGITEDEYAQGAIDNLATYNAYIILRKPDYNYAIDICHNLQSRLHVACVSGLGAGFMTAGFPDQEYVKAIELCKSPRITKDERAGCFKRVLHLSYLRYSSAKHQEVCALSGLGKNGSYCE